MNASTILNDDMTLEEKLDAIDKMMRQAQDEANKKSAANGQVAAPVDPASLTICDGCE